MAAVRRRQGDGMIKAFHKRIPLSVPHMGGREMEFIRRAFESNWLSTVGPNLDDLEARFAELAGAKALAVCAGTAALHLALRLAGVGPGDEVVCQSLTFVATANPILYQGATPVFVDSERQTWNMDPELLSRLLEAKARAGRLPKAVILVHIFGIAAQVGAVQEVCGRHGVVLIEDAAEALGTTIGGRQAGSFGDAGVFSLNGNKVITSAGGGVLVSNRPGWVEKARHWSAQACDPGRDYAHSEMGHNYRMSNVLAGIALGQFELLEDRVAARRGVAARYREGFAGVPGISFMPDPAHARNSMWLSCALVDEAAYGMGSRDLIEALDEANVTSRPVWKPLHTQALFRRNEVEGGEVAETLNRTGICLPSSSSLTVEEQDFVIECVRNPQRAARASG